MSRCFPFPPPGYEKKTRTDDVDLLKKEKDKEEKRKKEKKDREKKEKKEKREKDRSDGKHKDKKEKKEKHREKKKDKDKERDKNKNKEKKNVTDKKKNVPNSFRPFEKEQKLKDKNSVFWDEKVSRNHTGPNGEKLQDNANSVKENKGFQFIPELDRRIKYDDGGGSQMPHKFPLMCQKKDEATARVVDKGNSPWQDGNGRGKDKAIGNETSNGLGIKVDTRPSVNAIVPNHAGIFQPRAEGLPEISEKNFEKMQESEEPIKGNKGDGKQGDKRRDRDKEKNGHRKDEDGNKEKIKEEKAKEQVEHKNSEHSSKLKESNKFNPFCTNSFSQLLKDIFKNAASDQNLKKRKDFKPNGVLHANDNWPNKLPRPSSRPFSENGSIPESKQISAPCERQITDIIEARLIPAPSSKPVSGSTSSNHVAVVSVKSPHPDTKYLKQVYSVPQIDIWSELDDQEWLYNSSSMQQSKPQVESSDTDQVPLVWAEALLIEQVDGCVLPYVIPY